MNLECALLTFKYNKDSSLVPEFVDRIKDIENLTEYILDLPEVCKKGKAPIMTSHREQTESIAQHKVHLYWNPKEGELYLDWEDVF